MIEPKHNFQIGDTVYLMSGKKLYKGIVTDNKMYDAYVNVTWLNQSGGHGSPCYLSLHKTKDGAIQEWYINAMNVLNKSHKRLLNTKIK
jgi:hypothetical protein